MTKQEYENRKEELEDQHKALDDHMDFLGFTPYQDGAGDFGERRFIKDKNVWKIWILDMEPDFMSEEYPDGQFLGRCKDYTKDRWLETVEDIDAFISNEANINFTIKTLQL